MKNNFQFIKDDVSKIHSNIDFTEMKNKSILITGATGLVGTYLLLSLNDIIDSYNIKVTIIHKSEIDDVFRDIIDFSKVTCINEDITNINLLEQSLGKYDYIIHSAGYGQPNKFLENELKTLELNTTSTFFLFNLLNVGGKFLFISSSEVYSGLESEQVEYKIGPSTPEHDRACYIEGKRCGETICNIYRKHGVDAKSIRLSLTFGPGTKKDDKRFLTNFIQKSIQNSKIELLDHGSSIRTYIYITDAIIMMWNIFLNGKSNVYNVGGDESKSILDIANEIGDIMGVNVIIPDFDNSLSGSPKFVNVDMNKYYNEFGQLRLDSVREGLIKTIMWQKIIYS